MFGMDFFVVFMRLKLKIYFKYFIFVAEMIYKFKPDDNFFLVWILTYLFGMYREEDN